MEDWARLVGDVGGRQYEDRIAVLKGKGIDTQSIENTIAGAITNFRSKPGGSFVIFGEPQSGKTEMMIALNAKLLDEGCDVIVNLLTDSVDLLRQSLSRFRSAGLSPSPKEFSELPDDPDIVASKRWIIFSKKNARDLEKLIEILRFTKSLVVIDDEADYASPNSKINADERTKINQLIFDLLSNRGNYIGVTATPARLDLNNTFENVAEDWVDFVPHSEYVGQDFFFPNDGRVKYRLFQFSADEGNERIELRNAIFHFLCGVAQQHAQHNRKNFTMLVHTSGKIDEHSEDVRVIHDTINVLSSPENAKFSNFVEKLLGVASLYSGNESELLVEFVLRNINRNQVVIINSKGKKSNVGDILDPKALFSFGAGGNIVSRGVTFENLLSMYFTRSVKGKFTQDTYIQRARMFGSRKGYQESFQLWVPETVMQNWARCFAYHRLAIDSIRSGNGAPVWLSDHKTTPTSPSSIDRSSVDFEDGEMSWALFEFASDSDDLLMVGGELSDKERLARLRDRFSNEEFPTHISEYIRQDIIVSGAEVCFHQGSIFGTKRSKYSEAEIDSVRRKKGIFSTNEFRRGIKPAAKHHLKIFYNQNGKARLFYKINGSSIRFIQNRQ